MTVENKDYLVPAEPPAKLSTDLKDKMLAMDITNGRFAGKFPGNIMKFVSDDTQQVLLATIQTITGAKTFTQNVKLVTGKLLSLDDISGLRLTSANVNTISDNDTLYTKDKLLLIAGGNLEVLDHGQELNDDIIAFGNFGLETVWTDTGDFDVVINGSGDLQYVHSSGSGTIEQTTADFVKRLINNEFYVFTYDVIVGVSGDVAIEITTDTATVAVPIDLTAGTDKKVFFKFKSTATKFKLSGTSTSGLVTLDNFRVERLGGTVEAKKFGPGGNVEISGLGDITSLNPIATPGNSGFFGSRKAAINQQGLQFADQSNARFTEELDIGMAASVASSKRFRLEKVQEGQTVDAATLDLDFPIDSALGRGGVIMVYLMGIKDDGTLMYSRIMQNSFRFTGSLFEISGEQTIGAVGDEFSGVVSQMSVSGNNIRVSITGVGGHNIDWSAQIIGHGNIFKSVW